MPAFEYQAQRENGETVESIAYGTSPDEVKRHLQQFGLNVTSIRNAYLPKPPAPASQPALATAGATQAIPAAPPVQPVQNVAAPSPAMQPRNIFLSRILGPIVGRVSLKEQMFFFRQFAVMLEAGVAMGQVLDTLASQTRNIYFRKVLQEMRDAALEGQKISLPMERYPEVFKPIITSLVKAGEEGGFLPTALRLNADYLAQEIEIRNLYRRETMMTKLQIFFSIVIIIGANFIIDAVAVPGTNPQKLYSPLTNIENYKYIGLLVLAALIIRIALMFHPIRLIKDAFLIYVPFIGKTLHHFAMAKFGRALSALYKGGVDIPRSIYLSAEACGNEYLSARIRPASAALQSGAGIHETLSSTRAFSPIVMNMVSTGEMTGNLDLMLNKMAEYYEEEGVIRAKQMANLVGVLAIICLGIYIFFVLLNFYMGRFQSVVDAAGD